MNTSEKTCTIDDVEEALLYLSKIGALKMEGGFMVIYNAMQIHRLTDMKYKYKKEDYRLLDEFYKQKIRQIHIVGEYANLMVKDYGAALQFVQDYFLLDHKQFVSQYFKGDRAKEIEKNITMEKYRQLFGELSEKQREIIQDKQSKCIVVAAGPGSGKTRVLVHKLASLLLMEDVKHEQLLMLTFSRAAAIEFKQRLIKLIGGAAHFVDIKTFHSFSFDLIGKTGNLEEADHVVRMAADMIENGERDVYLDFFKDKKEKILSLRSGQPLWFKDNGFYSAAGDCVGVLSAKKRNELQELYRQGFTVYAAEVAFVAAWRGENDTVESAVMLPRMHLRR